MGNAETLKGSKAKADKAQSNAETTASKDATNKANTAESKANNYTNTLKNSLDGVAFGDKIEIARLGLTVIDGGFIKTSLLNADWIQTNILTAEYIQTLQLYVGKGGIKLDPTATISFGNVTGTEDIISDISIAQSTANLGISKAIYSTK